MTEEKEEIFKTDPYTEGIKVYTDRTKSYTEQDRVKGVKFHLSKLTDDGKKIESIYQDFVYKNLSTETFPFTLESPILNKLERRAMYAHQTCLNCFYGNAMHITAAPMVGKSTYLKTLVKACSGPKPDGSKMGMKKFDKIYIVSFRERYKEIIEFEQSVLEGRSKEDSGIIFVRVFDVFGNPDTGEVGVSDVLLNAKRDVISGLDVLLVVDSITRVIQAESKMIPFGAATNGGLNPDCEEYTAWWYDSAQLFHTRINVNGEIKNCYPSLTFITTNLDQSPGKPDNAKGLINGWVEGKADCHIYLSPEAKKIRDIDGNIITPVDLISSLNRSLEKYFAVSCPKGTWYPARDNCKDDLITRIRRFENIFDFYYSENNT